MPYVQSRIHSDYDSAASIADSDLEYGKLRKMQASPLYVHGRGEYYGSSRKPTASGKPEAEVIQKRGASAQRTQADHFRRERAWCQIHLKSHECLGNRMQCFQQGATNRETSSRVLFLICWSIKIDEISCSVREDLNLWSKSIKLDLSTALSMSFSNKLTLWITGRPSWIFWISKRTSSSTRRIIFEGKTSPRDSKYEIFMNLVKWRKRAQELRVDEFSLQKLRESHDTIKKLTSQIQELQEQMNSLSDSGEFHEVESNIVEDWRTFPVRKMWFRVLLPCWAATNACHETHGIRLDYRKTFFGNQFSTFGSSRNPSQGIHYCATPRETESFSDLFRKRWRAK